jgi:hypothetical protein
MTTRHLKHSHGVATVSDWVVAVRWRELFDISSFWTGEGDIKDSALLERFDVGVFLYPDAPQC